jgi:formate--tetrahydrofolate ligase
VTYSGQAEQDLDRAARWGFDRWPVCMAKTPLSLSHDPVLKGRPSGFVLPVGEVRMLAGAGFLTAVCSGMELLPGLPAHPAGEHVDLDPVTGEIIGLT